MSEGFDSLGFHIQWRRKRGTDKWYVYTFITKRPVDLLLDGELATAEPKKLRYRLLHVAARITRSARRSRLRIAEG